MILFLKLSKTTVIKSRSKTLTVFYFAWHDSILGMNIPILFENNDILIINKPAGLVVHPDGKTNEPTVVDWILEHYPSINGVGENMILHHKDTEIEINRPGIVHRIDRDTSGILVIAKTQDSFEFLKQQFKDRSVHKTYTALVYEHIKSDEGTINEPIGRDSKDFRKKIAGKTARGMLRDAETHYRVIERYVDTRSKKDKQGNYSKYTLVECMPVTGRTHQIRVHMKWLNHPIVADTLYKGKRKEVLGMERTALHATRIECISREGTEIIVEAPLPEDMQNVINSLSIVSATLY